MLHRIQLKTSVRAVTENSLIRASTCNAILRVAILSLFLASTLVFAQAPAGLNRPAGVPEGYVITPFGYFHPSCVLRLAEGENLLAGLVVQHADGTSENVTPCYYPHFTASGETIAAA